MDKSSNVSSPVWPVCTPIAGIKNKIRIEFTPLHIIQIYRIREQRTQQYAVLGKFGQDPGIQVGLSGVKRFIKFPQFAAPFHVVARKLTFERDIGTEKQLRAFPSDAFHVQLRISEGLLGYITSVWSEPFDNPVIIQD